MKGEIVQVVLSPKREALEVIVRINRPIFPKNYAAEKESDTYMKAMREWQDIHTGAITFEFEPIFGK
jgi:hypothetical protein